ncbi:MAG: LacI family DNA-binding transcriptional regulator [Kiritimatiellia bacterium]
MSKRVSTISIAKECGVSQPTVSRILQDHAHLYKDSTVEKVREAADRLGYRPSHMARSLRSGRTNCIAMLVDGKFERSEIKPQFLVNLAKIAEQSDYHVILSAFSDPEVEDDSFMPLILKHLMADGLIVNYHTTPPPHMIELIDKYRIPSVWINHRREHNAVFPDEFAAGRQLTERLIAAGHKRIAYVDRRYLNISTAEPHYSRVDRFRGYSVAMQEAGLDTDMIVAVQAPEDFDLWIELLRNRLLDEGRPTALLSSGYDEDIPHILRGALGLRFPEDISFASISWPEPGSGVLGITNDWQGIAQEAFQMILAKITTKSKSHKAVCVPPILRDGTSVGPVPVSSPA